MILTGEEIKRRVTFGEIHIKPFVEKNINPNSYNYRLGDEILKITDRIIDPKHPSKYVRIHLTEKGVLLRPGKVYLGKTLEEIGSDHYAMSLIGRSSMGRLGMFLQIAADLGHIGSKHCWTLEIYVVQPLRIYPGMKIGQVSFWKILGNKELKDYKERYQIHNEPRISEFFKEL